jgi:hypothetical protein
VDEAVDIITAREHNREHYRNLLFDYGYDARYFKMRIVDILNG